MNGKLAGKFLIIFLYIKGNRTTLSGLLRCRRLYGIDNFCNVGSV